MKLRLVMLGALVAVASTLVPASADDPEGTGVVTQYAGIVAGTSIEPNTIPRSEEIAGWCSFAGATTTDGGIQFAYGGYAVAYSTTTDQPELTVVTCTIVSPAQGLPGEQPTLSQSRTIALPGPSSATADSTGRWPLRPVKICVSGYTTYGPVEPVTRTINQTCRSTTL